MEVRVPEAAEESCKNGQCASPVRGFAKNLNQNGKSKWKSESKSESASESRSRVSILNCTNHQSLIVPAPCILCKPPRLDSLESSIVNHPLSTNDQSAPPHQSQSLSFSSLNLQATNSKEAAAPGRPYVA